MQIGTAIVVLTSNTINPGSISEPALKEAEKLGIEALRFIQLMRVGEAFSGPAFLPGETPEDTADAPPEQDAHGNHSRRSVK